MNKNNGLYTFEFIVPPNQPAGDAYYQSNEGFLNGKEIVRIWYYQPGSANEISDLGLSILQYPGGSIDSIQVTAQDVYGREVLKGVDLKVISYSAGFRRQTSNGWEFAEKTFLNWSRFKLHFGSAVGNTSGPVAVIFLVEYVLS